MRRAPLAALAVAGLLAGAPSANAALKWGSCPSAQAFECAVLRVPLDRSGHVVGTIPLHVARTRAGTHRRGLVAPSRGPPAGGGAAAALTPHHPPPPRP